jgi:voltage-gated potassium channel
VKQPGITFKKSLVLAIKKSFVVEGVILYFSLICAGMPLVFYFIVPIDLTHYPKWLTLIIVIFASFEALIILVIMVYLTKPFISVLETKTGFLLSIVYAYLLLILGYAGHYFLLAHVPGQFQGYIHKEGFLVYVESVYFSVTTTATVGFGDIHPASVASRWVTTTQVVTAFLMAIFFAIKYPKDKV